MIEFFRRASSSLIARIFFGLLAISFAIMWGGQEGLRMIGVGRDATVATVGSETITNRDLALTIERFRIMAQAQGGGELTDQQIRQSGLDRQLLETLIAESLIRQEAKTLNVSVSDDFVIESLRANQMFKRADGTFSKEVFQRFISSLGFRSEKEYVDYMKSEILRVRVIDALSANASLPTVSHEPLFAWNEQVRSATAMIIDPMKTKLAAEPSDDELRDYYGKNQNRFALPERRTFKAVIVPTKTLKVDVKENDIETMYDLEKDTKYKDMKDTDAKAQIRAQLRREAAQAEMINVSNAMREAFDEGASIQDIATKNGYEVRQFSEVTAVDRKGDRDAADQAIIDYAFLALEGDLSPLEEIQDGKAFVSIFVEGIKEPSQMTFDEAKAEVKEAVVIDQRIEKTKDVISKIEEDLKGGKSFKAVAADKGFKVVSLRATRQKMLSPTPKDLLSAQATRLFIIPNGGMTIVPFVIPGKGVQYALAKITDVRNGNAKKDPEGFNRFVARLKSQSREDIYQAYVNELRVRYSIDINERYFK